MTPGILPSALRASLRLCKIAPGDFVSLHAGVSVQPHERKKLEHLCRYVALPAVSEQRLALTREGKVRYELKTPYKDGTTHVIFEPLDFIARLAALVPKPRVNLTRYHGVFAPNSKYRVTITPAGRGKGSKAGQNSAGTHDDSGADPEEDRSPVEQRAAMTWARRLKRVFRIDITECEQCQGPVRILASIEDPIVIRQILDHLVHKEAKDKQDSSPIPPSRAPPGPQSSQRGLFE